MFLDNSACNLASLNLRKFQKEDGTFDVDRFRAAARIFLTAQEILVDNAGYPSAEIAKNSHDFRPLGLGFANLGALLMAMGLPYDSDEGRAVAAAIMAMEHCEGYARSAEIAANEKIGTFNGFEANREPFLEVMRMHRDAVEEIHPSCPDYLRAAAQESADRMVALGEQHGYRNAQATVLAPDGHDRVHDGLRHDGHRARHRAREVQAARGQGRRDDEDRQPDRPRSAHPAGLLRRRAAGRSSTTSTQNDTIEGAPGLKDEHLPVFDCAFKPFNGERSIGHLGHIKMMAACQPFISGAISKTVNLPEHATVEDIADAYLQGWKLGLKAVAIYRENSKRSQPLSTKEGGNTKNKEVAPGSGDGAAVEAGLSEPADRGEGGLQADPQAAARRAAEHHAQVLDRGARGLPPHRALPRHAACPARSSSRWRSRARRSSGMMDAFATAISLAFQYGVPLEDLCAKFSPHAVRAGRVHEQPADPDREVDHGLHLPLPLDQVPRATACPSPTRTR